VESERPRPGQDWQAVAVETLRETLVREAMEDLDRPHVVLVGDVELGLTLVLGPFPDALTAAVAADAQRREDDRELGPSSVRTYRVSLIFPPMPVAV
jgi:hypothetical protein